MIGSKIDPGANSTAPASTRALSTTMRRASPSTRTTSLDGLVELPVRRDRARQPGRQRHRPELHQHRSVRHRCRRGPRHWTDPQFAAIGRANLDGSGVDPSFITDAFGAYGVAVDDLSDTTPPRTKITRRAPKKTEKTKVTFKFTSSKANSTFECKLDKKLSSRAVRRRRSKRLEEGQAQVQGSRGRRGRQRRSQPGEGQVQGRRLSLEAGVRNTCPRSAGASSTSPRSASCSPARLSHRRWVDETRRQRLVVRPAAPEADIVGAWARRRRRVEAEIDRRLARVQVGARPVRRPGATGTRAEARCLPSLTLDATPGSPLAPATGRRSNRWGELARRFPRLCTTKCRDSPGEAEVELEVMPDEGAPYPWQGTAWVTLKALKRVPDPTGKVLPPASTRTTSIGSPSTGSRYGAGADSGRGHSDALSPR